jgi:inhibitor of cysteine peptidase
MVVRKFRAVSVVGLALALGLLVGACGPVPGAVVTPTPTVAPTEPVEPGVGLPGGVIRGEAQIEELDVRILESFPVQVHVGVRGWLGDGCTELAEIEQSRVEDTFVIRILTERPAEAICTMQLVGFEENIALDVVGLPAGTYTVDVNGATSSFTLDVDNVSEG